MLGTPCGSRCDGAAFWGNRVARGSASRLWLPSALGKGASGVDYSYAMVRQRLLAIMFTIIAICALAVIGVAQMAKVAHFHELNALHLQASDALRSLLRASAPAIPNTDTLRNAVARVRAQSFACLSDLGWLERLEIHWLRQDRLVSLCAEDVAQADRTLALIDAFSAGTVGADVLTTNLDRATSAFVDRSNAFIAPVTAVGSSVLRWIMTGMIVTGLIAIAFVVGIVRRISEAIRQLQQANESLAVSELRNRHLALYDSLTGLPNRNLFIDRLNQAIAAVQRSQAVLAVMFIDLDRFKNINDSLGHGAGDELLTVIGGRLQSVVRDTDTVARLGGDEFAIILSQMAHADDPRRVAQRILEVVGAPVLINGFENQISASIGITLCPQDGNDGASLLKHADLAMYEAKSSGRNGYRFYSHGSDESTRLRIRTEQHLRHAVAAGQLRLHYQPIIELASGATVGAEALVRWMHPEDGLAFPDSFIALAEETGLIVEIGIWVMNAALAQCAAWRAHNPAFTMAVNVSVRQLRDPALIDQLTELLDRHDIPASNLHVEITESLFLSGDDIALSTLHMLGELGVVLSIDDFGTGYSSFGYLRQLPFRILKIDRSFIRNLPESRDGVAVTSAIVGMAAALGLKVVAEGIESERHRRFLQSLDCQMGQGYLFSRPVPADEFDPGRRFAAETAIARSS